MPGALSTGRQFSGNPATTGTGSTTSWNRDRVETGLFGVLRIVVIAGLLLITLFPFYYSVLLSLRPLDAVLQDPGALLPTEVDLGSYASVLSSAAAGGQARACRRWGRTVPAGCGVGRRGAR